MKKIRTAVIILILLLPSYAGAAPGSVRAFDTINQLPFKQIFGLPSLDNIPVTEQGGLRFILAASLSNTYDISSGPGELIVTDIETLRASLKVRYGLRANWQIGIELPYVRHSGGILDDFIYDWHDLFGMPQNGRDRDNSDQLDIFYMMPGGDVFSLSGSGGEIGDIRINSAYTRPWGNRAFVFSAELKFPTGDFDRLTGSGGSDFSLGLTVNDPYSLKDYNITLFGGLAGVYLGDIDGEPAEIQKNFAVAGRAGFGWQVSDFIQLKAQVDALSALYDSDLEELGDNSLQLTFGAGLSLSDHVSVDISIAEDIMPTTAADVVMQAALILTY